MSHASDDVLADAHALFPERFIPGQMHGLIEAEHLSRYWWASAHVGARRVLDAGCGVGYGSQILAAAGARSVSGIDISNTAIAEATEHAGERITFAVGDLAALPFEDASFDVVVCFEAIEHVTEQSRALRELRRVLARDGLLLISSPNRNAYQQGNPYHTHEYTPEELGAALGERFGYVRLERQATWLASMICDDTSLQQRDPAHALDLDVRKVGDLMPGSETFTLALASDGELPPARALTLLTDAAELEAWRARARSAEQHVERAGEAYRSLDDAYHAALSTIDQHAERAREAGAHAAASYRSLDDTYRATRREYDDALTAIAEHEANAGALAEEQRGLHAELDAASARERELSARADQLARELDAAHAELAAAHAELAAVTQSPVWRASAPLRALGRRGRAR